MHKDTLEALWRYEVGHDRQKLTLYLLDGDCGDNMKTFVVELHARQIKTHMSCQNCSAIPNI